MSVVKLSLQSNSTKSAAHMPVEKQAYVQQGKTNAFVVLIEQ